MKKLKAAFALCATVVTPSLVFSNEVCEKHLFTLNCGAGTIETVDFRGLVNIDGTKVTKSISVLGNLKTNKAHLYNLDVFGNAELKETTTANTLKISGNINAEDLNILGTAQIFGNFQGKQSTFNASVKIYGNLECNKCYFKEKVDLTGNTKVVNTQFVKSINIDSTKTEFYRSYALNISVKAPSDQQQQTIELLDGSAVQNIHFESNKGIVIAKNGSKVNGNVTGGKLITR